MKTIILLLILLLHTSEILYAGKPVPTDADVCADLLSAAIEKILSGNTRIPGRTVRLTYSHGIQLSPMASETVDALITSLGLSITNSMNKAETTIDISVTDISIILLSQNGCFNRTVALSVHLKCLDASGTVLLASGSRETAQDVIPEKKFARSTDNGHMFGRGVKRTVIAQDYTKFMVVTLLVIIAALVYYSDQ